MAPKSSGTAPEAKPAATAPAEPAAPAPDAEHQNIDVNAQLLELQGKLAELQAAHAVSEQDRINAQALALQNEAKYRGLQHNTTKTLQQAAEDKKVFEQYKQNQGELAEIKELLSTVASRVLDEDERKELQYRQRELKVKLAEQAVAAQAAEPQAATSYSYQDPEDAKSQFLNTYFPGIGIDPKDPGIDWGDGAEGAEAFRRFTTSVIRLKDQKDQVKTQDAYAAIQKQTEEALAAFKTQQAELVTATQAEIAKAKEEAITTARKDSEKKLRALGADVPGTPPADAAAGGKSLMSVMNEQLDDTLLRTKSGREEYARRMDAIRNTVRGR
jgi:hypothetical protein